MRGLRGARVKDPLREAVHAAQPFLVTWIWFIESMCELHDVLAEALGSRLVLILADHVAHCVANGDVFGKNADDAFPL